MIEPALSAGAYRAARAYLNWSTPKLARMAGVAVKTVFDAERGRRVPAEDLARIEQAFRDGGVVVERSDGLPVALRWVTDETGETPASDAVPMTGSTQ